MAKPLVIAGMATYPARHALFDEAVRSIARQVDRVVVYMNGYINTIKWLPENVEQVLGPDWGDAGKFRGLEVFRDNRQAGREGYYLSCDDDLLYADGYAEHMIRGVDRYLGQAVVSLHGMTPKYQPQKSTSYYNDPAYRYRCLGHVQDNVRVTVLGSGAAAFRTDALDLWMYGNFGNGYMADLWLSLAAAQQGVERIVLAHPVGMVEDLPHVDSLYRRWRHNDAEQTRALNMILQHDMEGTASWKTQTAS